MAYQNLVSAVITPEVGSAIAAQLTEIHTRLNFNVSLSPEQKQRLSKAGQQRTPFLAKAVNVALTHSGILARDFDDVEYKKDYDLMVALEPISVQLTELNEMVKTTLMAVKSDLYYASRDVYKHASNHADKSPGLNATIAELAAYFKHGPSSEDEVPTDSI